MSDSTPAPLDESQRQMAVDRLHVVDSLPEQTYQDIVRIAASVCDTPIALVSLLDRDRQWFKARLGLDAEQTSRSVAVCEHAIRNPRQLLEVEDLSRDPRFADFPAVTGDLAARFYAGMPLVTDEGAAVGTVCVVDHQPRELNAAQRDALQALGRVTMNLLQARQHAHDQQVIEQLDQSRQQAAPLAPTQDAGYTVAILELQGLAGVVQQRGERGMEKELHALELQLEPLLDKARGDTINRVTGSGEFVAVLQGDDSQPRLQALQQALHDFQQRSGLCVLMGAAAAAQGQEATQWVFLRADAALSQAKDALPASAPHTAAA